MGKDIEHPIALNMFDVNMERLSTYSPLVRERFDDKNKGKKAIVNPFLFLHFPVNNEVAPEYHLAPQLFLEPWDRVGGLTPFSLQQ